MYVEGKILNTKGEPIPGATIDTWESDGEGIYDNQAGLRFLLPQIERRKLMDLRTYSMKIVPSQTVEAGSSLRQMGALLTGQLCA